MTSPAELNIPVIKINANQGEMNCLMLSPLQMASLCMQGAIGSTVDGTGINCQVKDHTTGLQSEMPVFNGHHTSTVTNQTNAVNLCGLVKLIKTATSELSGINFPQIDCLVVNSQGPDKETARIFDNMRMAVFTSGTPSRYYNRCYLTCRDYTEAESELLTGRRFSGSMAIYGERFYLVSLQYSKDLEYLFPIADAYFNLIHKLIPLSVAAPGLVGSLAHGRMYLKCQIRRTSGAVQTGFIKTDRFSMLSYKSRTGEGAVLIPYITVYFKSNGMEVQDIDDSLVFTPDEEALAYNEQKFPTSDCFKTIMLSDFLAENPQMAAYFAPEIGFEQLTLRVLGDLIAGEQH